MTTLSIVPTTTIVWGSFQLSGVRFTYSTILRGFLPTDFEIDQKIVQELICNCGNCSRAQVGFILPDRKQFQAAFRRTGHPNVTPTGASLAVDSLAEVGQTDVSLTQSSGTNEPQVVERSI